jgi:hypothetical protein
MATGTVVTLSPGDIGIKFQKGTCPAEVGRIEKDSPVADIIKVGDIVAGIMLPGKPLTINPNSTDARHMLRDHEKESGRKLVIASRERVVTLPQGKKIGIKLRKGTHPPEITKVADDSPVLDMVHEGDVIIGFIPPGCKRSQALTDISTAELKDHIRVHTQDSGRRLIILSTGERRHDRRGLSPSTREHSLNNLSVQTPLGADDRERSRSPKRNRSSEDGQKKDLGRSPRRRESHRSSQREHSGDNLSEQSPLGEDDMERSKSPTRNHSSDDSHEKGHGQSPRRKHSSDDSHENERKRSPKRKHSSKELPKQCPPEDQEKELGKSPRRKHSFQISDKKERSQTRNHSWDGTPLDDHPRKLQKSSSEKQERNGQRRRNPSWDGTPLHDNEEERRRSSRRKHSWDGTHTDSQKREYDRSPRKKDSWGDLSDQSSHDSRSERIETPRQHSCHRHHKHPSEQALTARHDSSASYDEEEGKTTRCTGKRKRRIYIAAGVWILILIGAGVGAFFAVSQGNGKATSASSSSPHASIEVFGKEWDPYTNAFINYNLIGSYSGEISSEIGLLTSLGHLSLSCQSNDLRLTGTLPTELGLMTRLSTLSISGCSLTGTIPSEIGYLSLLKYLSFGQNFSLKGSIPSDVWELTNLQSLYLDDTSLSGSLSPDVGRLVNLEKLWLHGTRVSGPIPNQLGKLVNLKGLDFGSTNLSGTIPSSICKNSQLREINVECTEISCSCSLCSNAC